MSEDPEGNALSDAFQTLISNTIKDHPERVKEIAHIFGVSFPMVKRWATGESGPHHALIPKATECINRAFPQT